MIPSYPKADYKNITSSLALGAISEDEDENGDRKIAEGLSGIKSSYNDIKSVYAQSANVSPQKRDQKIAEGLGKIKESYDNIKSQYAYDADNSKLTPKEARKIAEGLDNIKKTYSDIKSAYA